MTDDEGIVQKLHSAKNEVLVRWVGWRWEKRPAVLHPRRSYWQPLRGPAGAWIEPCGDRHPRVPDLYHSLDAQAKWLWPKLEHLELQGPYPDATYVAIVTKYNGADFERESLCPAEACAEAVLAMIGEGE